MKRVEKDPHGGWIARDRNGADLFEPGWRWNTRASAQEMVREHDRNAIASGREGAE